jgi:hypothetical protein
MQRWEQLITADLRHDLADPGRAGEWLKSQEWWPKAGGSEALWTAKAQALWAGNLRHLRVLAKRLKGVRTRKTPGGPPADEDAAFSLAIGVLSEHLGMLRAVLPHAVKGARAVLAPTLSTGMPLPDPRAYFALDDLRVYWQAVFTSLVVDGPDEPVCESCGAALGGKTPTGRARRRRHCDKCRWKEWRKRQSPEDMRKKWREDKQNHKA